MGIYSAGRPLKFDPFAGTGHKPPNKPGEYRMRDASGSIAYIGETNSINRRMREHINSGKLQPGYTLEYKLADGRSSSRTRRVHEQAKIAQHSPSLNRSVGGEGRIAKKR